MIIHVDMDAFFAAVEIREDPSLREKAVIVGGTPDGRGVVSTANYVARKFGVHSAMPAAQAKRLCPHAIFLRPRMQLYAQVSQQIREIFHTYTGLVEPLSLDEAFLDVGPSQAIFGDPLAIARTIQQRIATELQLTASAGVAPNKFLAKLASDLHKPNGLVFVSPEQVESFLDPLDIGRMWGVGKQTLPKFHAIGVHTIGDLRRLSHDTLMQLFGSSGDHYYRLARGIDDRKVVPEREAKSISNETTFPQDIDDLATLDAWLRSLADQVSCRLRAHELLGKTIHIKIRYANFDTITRSETVRSPTQTCRVIEDTAVRLLHTHVHAQRGVRLLGVGISQLSHHGPTQLQLFDQEEELRDQRLDAATDQIRQKFGRAAVSRGSALEHGLGSKRHDANPSMRPSPPPDE